MVQESKSTGGVFAAAIAKASPRARAEAGDYDVTTSTSEVIAKMAHDIAEGADRARHVQGAQPDAKPGD